MPASYEVRFKKSAQKDILRIHQPDLKRLVARIESLAKAPVPPEAVKLVGVPAWRLRQGDWRIIYSVDEAAREVIVVKVAHRREAYRDL